MTLLILAEEDFEAKEHSLKLFGFRKHRKVHDITAGLKQVVRHSIEWGKDESLHLGLADVKHAFETMTFERAASSMERVGIQAKRRLAILSCLIDNHGVVNFQDTTSEEIKWDTMIRTGGTEGPFLWNCETVSMWDEVVQSWQERGMGYSLEPSYTLERRLTHSLWADNILVYARTKQELQQMMSELSEPLYKHGFSWKPESLA